MLDMNLLRSQSFRYPHNASKKSIIDAHPLDFSTSNVIDVSSLGK